MQMGESKVLSKYYPLDFDPTKIPMVRRRRHPEIPIVRLKLPISLRCATCQNHIYKGTKFNSSKQDVDGVVRYCFKCSSCSAEITLTNRHKSDYIVESGAVYVVGSGSGAEDEDERTNNLPFKLTCMLRINSGTESSSNQGNGDGCCGEP